MSARHRSAVSRPAPPDALFQEMLRAARELLAVRSPLDAELMVSEMLGTWWGQRLRDTDVEEIFGDDLIEYAAAAATPAALALLTGIAGLGATGQAGRARHLAARLIEQGVARPRWAERVGTVSVEACHVSRDIYGDRDEAVCVFSYDGEDRHALIVVVDWNMDGMARDAWVTSKPDKLIDHCRSDARGNPLASFGELDARAARALLETALTRTDGTIAPPVSDTFASYHAFVRARIRALPPGGETPVPPGRERPYGRDRRAMLAVEFLASDEAEDLSDRSAAGRCVDRIIDFGCDRDFNRPLRVSPAKVEAFLLDWLPRKVMLTPDEQDAMPHVLAAWTRWTGRRTGLPAKAVRATLDAIWESTPKFAAAYRDPTTFGLDRDLVARLLPDGDLEALPRRTFAFPVLKGRHGQIDLSRLDPANPADRRPLVEVEHADAPHSQDEDHLVLHERVAAMLWIGDPPQLWSAAERLLDRGFARHEVLHLLMRAVARSRDAADLRRRLADLP